MQKLSNFQKKVIYFLKYNTFFIIVAVPFYAFFTTWIGSNTGGLLLLRAWKELLLIVMLAGAGYLLLTDKVLRKQFFKDRLVWLVAALSGWAVLTGVFLVRDPDAAALGLAIQFRSYVIFLIGALIVFYIKVSEATLFKLVTYPAIGVVAFGLLQVFVLPYDFLKHFGYQKDVTIPPYFTIDEQIDRIRISSTLRGPNPLGAYLIAPIMLVASRLQVEDGRWKMEGGKKQKSVVIRYTLYVIFLLIVLYASHSRSAWIGLLVAGAVYVWLLVSKRLKLLLVALGLVVAGLGGLAVYQYRQTNFVQDVILHDNPEEGGEVSSNQGRINAFNEAKSDIQKSPVWGCGIGCAGPASVHNQNGTKLAENYFIQTIQELGLVGLIFLLAIYALVALRLYNKKTPFALAWLAVFVGVSVVSLLSHAWADDTIAYIWWGVAGMASGLKARRD